MAAPEPGGPARRVVVTGLGVVSAAGLAVPDFWAALLAGRPALTPLDRFDPGRPARAAQIPDYHGPPGIPDGFVARLSRSAQFALDAALQAVADARIRFSPKNASQVAALIGTAHGPAGGGPEPGAAFFSSGLAGAVAGLNIAGPAYTIAADGASGLVAIQQAAAAIRSGAATVAIAGGAEAPLNPPTWAAYRAAGLLSSQAAENAQRPFDLLRDGLILGEGAAALVLEERGIAVARRARIYAEIAGAAQTAGPPGDGRPPTDIESARRALAAALQDAGWRPQEIDVLYAAGTGTREGDAREAEVLERCYADRLRDTYAATVTPVVGYTVGAAGALGAVAAALTLAEQVVPPHATRTEPDPACVLNFADRPRRGSLRRVALSAYGALGQNAALLLEAHATEGAQPHAPQDQEPAPAGA